MNINLKMEVLKIFNLEFQWRTGESGTRSTDDTVKIIDVGTAEKTHETAQSLPGPGGDKS